MFNNFLSYYLQICADDYMFCCSQNWISLHMLNALGPSRVLCAEWLAPCHRVFLKDDSPSHMPVTWEHRSEVLTGAPVEEWPGNICLGRKGSGEEEIQEFNSLLTPRGALGMGDREGKWSSAFVRYLFLAIQRLRALYWMRNLPEHLSFFLTAGRGTEGITSQFTISWQTSSLSLCFLVPNLYLALSIYFRLLGTSKICVFNSNWGEGHWPSATWPSGQSCGTKGSFLPAVEEKQAIRKLWEGRGCLDKVAIKIKTIK